MGQEKGMAYLTALAKQQIVNIPLSQRSVLDQVISGEHKLALMTFNHHSIISAREGAPVAWIKTMPLLASISAAGVLKAAPHPNAARLFYDFMVSLDGQKVIADALYLPALPGTPTPIPEALPANGHFATVLLDPEKSRTVVPEMTKIYDQLFR
jgi:iron(III) transport system substrate-binding protein